MFCKKAVLKHFTKSSEKHLGQSLFFKKETLVQASLAKACPQLLHSEQCFTDNNGKTLKIITIIIMATIIIITAVKS